MREVKIYCDMDGVLVHQTGRDGFDQMPWAVDGRELWDYVKQFRPTILSQLSPDIYDRGRAQKRVWCDRELGRDVLLIVARAWYYETAKYEYAEHGAVLIDDHEEQHAAEWIARGGVFIHHQDARTTILKLKDMMQILAARNYLDTEGFAA